MLPEAGTQNDVSIPDATATTTPSANADARRLAMLADVVERFARAWRASDSAPDLPAFLPDAPSMRRACLIELIKIDLANRWLRDDNPKRLAQYCEELPELRALTLPPDLIYEEFQVRRRSGHLVEAADYTKEFPDQAEQLESMLTSQADASALLAAPDRPAALDDVDVGGRIDDFDLMTSLGRGAFARVFLARQRSMQRLVAVKISKNRGTEPQTLAQLDHDYIVRVFDQRLLTGRELRLLYMQYVPGGTLLDVLRAVHEIAPQQRTGQSLLDAVDGILAERGEIRPIESSARTQIAALSWPETVAWLGRRLADALDYAGRNGVLHRDVKPANVLLTAEGVPKLADFNISFGGNVSGSSPVAYFGGSLVYMSPEQLSVIHPESPITAMDLDTRSDLYALAVLLWELLTGSKPFDDDSTPTSAHSTPGDRTVIDAMLARRHAGVEASPSARQLPPDCPATLRRALLKALRPEPDERWETGAQLAQQLDVCLDARARDLVDPPASSWRRRLRQAMHPILVLAIAVPNLIAILYSYDHNRILIIGKLETDAQHLFRTLSIWIYSSAFLIGFVTTNAFVYYLFSVLLGLRKGKTYDPKALARARSDTLLLGQRNALACFGLWVICGLGVPVTLQLSGHEVGTATYVHFATTQIVCGAIAMAYPFFLVNFYAVRCLYPVFLPHGTTGTRDTTRLRELSVRSTYFLAVAAAVPLIAVAGATFIPAEDFAEVIVPIRVLCLGSALAFVGVYWVFRLLEADLRALTRIAAA